MKLDKWISVHDELPESGQRVLTYYYDNSFELHQIDLLEYHEKGSVMGTKSDRDPNHTTKERLFNTLFNNDYDIVAPEDGFYISEYDENGDVCYRKHKDCITHWQLLPQPPKED
jgi:hypothetical protein